VGACEGAWACADAALLGPGDWVGAAVFELPHAAKDSAAAPAAARIATRVRRGASGLADIKVSPWTWFSWQAALPSVQHRGEC
jgi:hypothetical protein